MSFSPWCHVTSYLVRVNGSAVISGASPLPTWNSTSRFKLELSRACYQTGTKKPLLCCLATHCPPNHHPPQAKSRTFESQVCATCIDTVMSLQITFPDIGVMKFRPAYCGASQVSCYSIDLKEHHHMTTVYTCLCKCTSRNECPSHGSKSSKFELPGLTTPYPTQLAGATPPQPTRSHHQTCGHMSHHINEHQTVTTDPQYGTA